MTTLINKNETLNKIADVLIQAKNDRATIINEVIAVVIEESKNFKDGFATKKLAQKWIIENMLDGAKANEVNNYTKRALYVAKALLVDGYKIKKEWLSIAQAEKAVRCDKGAVNSFMTFDNEEDYVDNIKGEIDAREYTMAVKTLNKHDAMELFNDIKKVHGEDTRKILNAMLKAL
jgi:hypothetical protein